jgi:hypothetical protein
MQRTYTALNGQEAATAIAKKATQLALSIPGMNSRLTTFPRLKVTITVRVEAYGREPVEVTDMDDLIEKLVDEGMEPAYEAGISDYEAMIDEDIESADAIRRGSGQQTFKPGLDDRTGKIVDVPAEPLPAGENLSNVQQFGKPGGAVLADGTHYSGRGRVIENETVGLTSTGDVGSNPITQKLTGGSAATSFRIRRPGE